MKWLKNNLANLFTLGNLACGFLGIVAIHEGHFSEMFNLFCIALVLDFFDGFIARATKTNSKIGADLDSLADLITFGVLPGYLVYDSLPENKYLALVIPLLSAWRLAKFNNDERTSTFFYGLATPANALLVLGLFMYRDFWNCGNTLLDENYTPPEYYPFFRYFLVLIFSFLMVSEVKLLSNKISPFSLANAKWHIAVLAIAIILIAIFGYLGISFAIIAYVLISIIANFARSKTNKK